MQLESPGDRVAEWIRLARAGDEFAVRMLWTHCFARVAAFARRKLRGVRLPICDEEDIALSAIKSLCIGLRNGRYGELDDRDELWRLLLVITSRKVVDQIEYTNRKKRDVHRTLTPDGSALEIQDALSRAPTPQCEAQIADQLSRLLAALQHEDLCQIVVLKLEGYTNGEIAKRLQCSLTTVERKLRTIRSIWGRTNPESQ